MSFIGVQMAKRGGTSAPIEDGLDKAVTARPTSTANFLIDSVDRDEDNYPIAGDFQIIKNQALFNGFFNRMAVQEVVLDWGIPNISTVHENEILAFTYEFPPAAPVSSWVEVPSGFYTVANLLNALVGQMNVDVATPGAFVIASGNTGVSIGIDQSVVAGGTFEINEANTSPPIKNGYNLAYQLFTEAQVNDGQNQSYAIICPRLLPYRYLDFVSPQLTYNQELKDSDTSQKSKDVLYRWYFAWDEETSYDTLGFPVLQGYRSFIQRRLISFPKQIRWNNTQPVGVVQFQVYDDADEIVDSEAFPAEEGGAEMEFQMTFLLSEN
jgi:hypothetical protein